MRNFARFRRQFYLDISSRYLRLLTQKQSIRNAQVNVNSLRLNLIEHQEMRALKMVSQKQVDQIFKSTKIGRLILLAAEQDLIAAWMTLSSRSACPLGSRSKWTSVCSSHLIGSPGVVQLRRRYSLFTRLYWSTLQPMAWRLILPLRNIAGGIRKIPTTPRCDGGAIAASSRGLSALEETARRERPRDTERKRSYRSCAAKGTGPSH